MSIIAVFVWVNFVFGSDVSAKANTILCFNFIVIKRVSSFSCLCHE